MGSSVRVLDIFEAFARLQKPLTQSQIAEEVGAPISTCFGIVRSLEKCGYLHLVSDRKEWYPTGKMMHNTRGIERGEPLLARFDPILSALRDDTKETIILGQATRYDTGVVYLKVFEGGQAIRYSAAVGDRKELHSTAIGKVVLSLLPPDQRKRSIAKLKAELVTEATITEPEELARDIEAGLARGYQMTRGENVVDVGAIAMPVTVAGRTFGVAVAGPVHRLDRSLKAHAAALGSACRKLVALSP
jgi:IclR family transcriptional regulator, acetate operon repressor